MTVLVTYEPIDMTLSAFGATEQEASDAADAVLKDVLDKGYFARKEPEGHKLKDNLWGWNVMAKKIRYN